MAFTAHKPARLPLRPEGRGCDDASQASLTLRTGRSHPPRFAPDLYITHGGIATKDPGISPGRTPTGRLS